jgi:hypothetical protein
MMTGEQRDALFAALKEVHDRVHVSYPRGEVAAADAGRRLRNQLLVVDLAVHLAEEVMRAAPDERQVTERTANLLYAVRLLAPQHPLERVAELLLDASRPETS